MRVRVDDLEIVGVNSMRVELSTGIEANAFHVRIPNPRGEYTGMFVLPQEARQEPITDPKERSKLFDGRKAQIEIAGQVCFRGFCDDVRIEEIPLPSIELTGRDYTGLLIDEVVSPQLSAAVSNVTSSTAVTRIANAFKLTPKVEKTTKIWGENQAFAAGTPVWSVVAELAGKEGFDAYVTRDGELVFRKRVMPAVISKTIVVPALSGGARFLGSPRNDSGGESAMELEFYTAKTMALGLKVRCTGHDPKANRSIVFTAESPLRNRPNYKVIEILDRTLRTRDLVSARAWAELLRISKGLVAGKWTGPVDGNLRPGDALAVKYEGRRTGQEPLAGVYFVTKVTHNLAETGEFTTRAEFASKPLAMGTVEEIQRATSR